jgi:NifU-like protein involved in Fe-S cluster formation
VKSGDCVRSTPARDVVAILTYSTLVTDHFDRPRNVGRFEPAPDVVEGRAGGEALGAMFSLSARVSGDAIEAVRFQTYGCPHCVAAGSWLSERLVGVSRSQLAAFRWQEIAQRLEFPVEKRGRLLILEDAVRALARAWAERP